MLNIWFISNQHILMWLDNIWWRVSHHMACLLYVLKQTIVLIYRVIDCNNCIYGSVMQLYLWVTILQNLLPPLTYAFIGHFRKIVYWYIIYIYDVSEIVVSYVIIFIFFVSILIYIANSLHLIFHIIIYSSFSCSCDQRACTFMLILASQKEREPIRK